MTRIGWAAALTTLALTVSACGSADSDAEASSSTSEAAAAPDVVYDGPEAELPQDYGELPEGQGDDCVIGFQNLSAAQQSLSAEATGAEAEAAALGCEITVLDDELNLNKQVNNFDQLLAQQVSAIVVYPLVPDSMQPNIDRAAKAGIPVIAIQTPVSADQDTPPGYATSVLQGFDQAAYQRAKAVAAERPGGSFVVQGLAAPVAALQYFAERQRYWGEQFGLTFLGQVDNQDDTAAAATASVSSALAKYPDLDALFTYNDDSAAADATALQSAGKDDVLVAGFNGQLAAIQGIQDGSIFCTYQPDYEAVGKLTVDAAYRLIADPEAELPRIAIAPGTLITADNVDAATPLGS